MGMVVRTNTMAINAQRQLNLNNNKVSKSLEKLASGYKINRAGDDAAGLAISERMKAQIKGLDAASNNSQDGISLIQTAEGALNEVHDMMNRMVELATKAANGVYTESQRGNYKDEMDQLKSEINRIADSTNFNSLKLLDGSMGLNKDAFTITAGQAAQEGAAIDLTDPALNGLFTAGKIHTGSAKIEAQQPTFTLDVANLSATADGNITFTVGGANVQVAVTKGDDAKAIATKLATAVTNTNNGTAIGGKEFIATASGTEVNFVLKDASTVVLTQTEADAINNAIGKEVTATHDGGTDKMTGAPVHGLLNVKKAVIEGATKNAGAEIDLSKILDKDGQTLTIDGKSFIFKTNSNSAVTGSADVTLIDVSNITTGVADQAKEAAKLMSNHSTTNFVIADKGDGKIEIDQKISSSKVYATEDEVKSVVSVRGADTLATTKIDVDSSKIKNGDSLKIGDNTYKFVTKKTGAKNEILIGDSNDKTAKNLAAEISGAEANGSGVTVSAGNVTDSAPAVLGGGLTLQVGDTYEDFNLLNVAASDLHTAALGLDGVDITTQTSAGESINLINSAIDQVSKVRSGFGALQNRLEHTINNLDTTSENLTAANSRIRDTDMAKEMMEYTKMNVLVQSAQAMLAQANQQPQSVLQLLQ